MSQRVTGYTDGQGKARRAEYADEGGASAGSGDPVAMLGRLAIPGLTGPTGGAGPVERRLISEAERAIRAESRAEVRVRWSGAPKLASPSPSPQEEPAVESANIMTTPASEAPADALSDLAEAVVMAIEARDAKGIADTAWQIAQRDLAAAWRAMPPLDLLDDAPRPPEPSEAEVRHERLLEEPIAVPVRPSAEGGRATAEQLQQSRRNGQAQMQAQRRAVELTTTAAAKAERSPKSRTPEEIERSERTSRAMKESWARRKAALR